MLEGTINNENRWPIKLVCSILGENFKRYVSTSYKEKSDYVKLFETINLLKCSGKLLHSYLIDNPGDILESLDSVCFYFKDINSINQRYLPLRIPSIINDFMQLNKEYGDSSAEGERKPRGRFPVTFSSASVPFRSISSSCSLFSRFGGSCK